MIGDIISAGAKIGAGFLDAKQQEKNREMQREFAQKGIQWKVADAKAAGIHPLYALGAPTSSPAIQTGGGVAAGLASAGQDIGRAINATRTADDRDAAFNQTVKEMELQNITLRNDLLASQIQRLKQQQNPSMPKAGSDPSDEFQNRMPQGKAGTVTPITIHGTKIAQDPGISDAQDFENRYGETLSDWVFGPYIAWRDFSRQAGNILDRMHRNRATVRDRYIAPNPHNTTRELRGDRERR